MERFAFSWETNKVGDLKKMLQTLKDKVPEYGPWSLAALAGYLLAPAIKEEMKKRGIEPFP